MQQQLVEVRFDTDDPFPWAPAGYDPTPSWHAAVAEIRSLHARRGRQAATR